MRRRLLQALLALCVAVGVVAVTVEPAQAGIPCGTLQVCTYEHKGWGGQMYYYTGPFNSCIQIGGWWRDNLSSVINNKDIPVRLYRNSTCSYNLWNMDVQAHDDLYLCLEQLNDHVWSIWIGFSPP